MGSSDHHLRAISQDIPHPCYINGLVQDCNNSIANTLELLQSCGKPLLYIGKYLKMIAHCVICLIFDKEIDYYKICRFEFSIFTTVGVCIVLNEFHITSWYCSAIEYSRLSFRAGASTTRVLVSGTRLAQNDKHEYTKNIVLEYYSSTDFPVPVLVCCHCY